MGFRDNTNARAFPGLNFDEARPPKACATPMPRAPRCCSRSTPIRSPTTGSAGRRGRHAAELGMDAVILADPGLMRYAVKNLSAPAAASVGAGLGHQLRGDEFLPRAFRHPARRVAARAVAAAGGKCGEAHRGGDRAVRLRRPVRDGRGALPAVFVCHRRIAQHLRACARRPRRCGGRQTATGWSRA